MTPTFQGWRVALAVGIILIDTIVVQVSLGINSVIFPLTLASLGFSKTLIGLVLSIEVFAIVSVSRSMSPLIARLGLRTVLGILPPVRAYLLLCLSANQTWYGWMAGIYLYGLATNIFLVALQTWLNTIPVGKAKGRVVGAYSAALSAGVAIGPVAVTHLQVEHGAAFHANAVLCLLTWIPVLIALRLIPDLSALDRPRIGFVLRHCQTVMAAAFVGGFTWFGLPAFLTLFGVGSGLSTTQASWLLPMFMLGSVTLGWSVSSLSDHIDRRKVVLVCVFLSLLCAAYVPMAVYDLRLALLMLYLWGGLMGGIYAVCLTIVGERFRLEDQVSANITYVLMDAAGGFIGVFLIGVAMDVAGPEGLAYVIVSASISYFIFALSRHRVE